jgi:energy-coupling factor transporter ATP-binding protein EcfA2
LRNINLKIPLGMKLLMRGSNGAGNSTLLKALRGNVEHMIQEGTRTECDGLRLVGVFTQDLAQELDPNAIAGKNILCCFVHFYPRCLSMTPSSVIIRGCERLDHDEGVQVADEAGCWIG